MAKQKVAPRHFSRGPIEAFQWVEVCGRGCPAPRHFSRGPIEASVWGVRFGEQDVPLRGTSAAAPLKRQVRAPHNQVIVPLRGTSAAAPLKRVDSTAWTKVGAFALRGTSAAAPLKHTPTRLAPNAERLRSAALQPRPH